ncbi:homocysteine S-methyltransferase family protein [Pelagibacteraceae bacterium]|jgi:S-methylmethionine-dependent homocysteine/selenocysteine methylase|nr:homocysteine S-methyltransferase family protein [Pelagibacteraceae bacterium]
MNQRYKKFLEVLRSGETILLDGATGSELENRGIKMDNSWCATASLEFDILKQIHKDYINAGAKIITTNTYASNRMILEVAGVEDKFEEINLTAINAAIQAREECGRDDVLVAGSLSHQIPYEDAFRSQEEKDKYIKKLTPEYFQKSFDELAFFLADNGCDFILLELMYRPDRIDIIFDSASKVGLPVWAGFSSRNKDGLIALTTDYEYSFKKMISNVKHHKLDAVGIMHCDISVIEESIKELKEVYNLPIMAYPEVAVFNFPHYDMSNVIQPNDYLVEAKKWKDAGAQIIGGCCGTTVEHIKLLNKL